MSLLLQTPAEIRNYIFEYMLTGQTLQFLGLSPVDEKPILIDASTGKPFNTLKHTCQQLSRETRGLELQNNVLLFRQRDEHDSTPEEKLKLFCKHVPATQLGQLHAIQLRLAEDISGQELVALVRACNSVLPPSVKIHYISSHFRFSPPSPRPPKPVPWGTEKFMLYGMIVQISLQRRAWTESDWKRWRFEDACEFDWEYTHWIAQQWTDGVNVVCDEFERVRVLPDEDLESWIRVGEEGIRRLGQEKGVEAEVVEEWVGLGRGWVEHGV